MKQVGGQIFRLGGLILEMVGLGGVMTGHPGLGLADVRVPDGSTLAPAWIAVGLGFLIWLTGTMLIYGSRRARS
jgi:hypothetical protein